MEGDRNLENLKCLSFLLCELAKPYSYST